MKNENIEVVEKIVAEIEKGDMLSLSVTRMRDLAWDYLNEMDIRPDNCYEIVDAVQEMIQAKEQAQMDDASDIRRVWMDGEF